MKRLLAVLLLTAAPAMAFDVKAMNDEERAAFGAAVRDYLMENPEVLVEAINTMEERRMANESQNDKLLVQANAADIFEDGHSWVGGNPDGELTVVEFIDYRCGYCRRFNQEVHDTVEKDGNIRLILKEFPILGQDSDTSARFAVAVKQIAGDDAYIKAHDALMELRGAATLEALTGIATEIGVDADQVINTMNTEPVNEVLRANRQLAERMRIMGTPTFVIGDDLLRGVPQIGLAAAIEQIRNGADG